MKIKIERSRLYDGIKRVASGANAKTKLPILANVKLEAVDGRLCMTTTNLDMSLYTEVECTVEEAGATTVPIRLLNSIVSAMVEGEVTMTLNGDKMRIKGGNYVSQVGVKSADEFPKMEEDKIDCSFKVPVNKLRDMLRKTAFASSADETRRTLSSVLFEFSKERLRGVATDGRRMVIAEIDGEYACADTLQYIIPSMTIANLQRFIDGEGDVVIEASKNRMRFSLEDGKHEIVTKLVDGVYPNYLQVLPKDNDKIVEADRNEVIGAVERVSVMATREGASIKMSVVDNRMLVEVKGDDLCDAHDEIPVKYDGEKIEIIFNPRYILDYLRASDADVTKMEFKDGTHAASFKSTSEKFVCTLMPLRTTNV